MNKIDMYVTNMTIGDPLDQTRTAKDQKFVAADSI